MNRTDRMTDDDWTPMFDLHDLAVRVLHTIPTVTDTALLQRWLDELAGAS